jgi:hypothetical protein
MIFKQLAKKGHELLPLSSLQSRIGRKCSPLRVKKWCANREFCDNPLTVRGFLMQDWIEWKMNGFDILVSFRYY